MKSLAVLGALPIELEPFWDSMEECRTESWGKLNLRLGTIEAKDIISFATGVGKIRAAAGTQFVIDRYFPSAIIFIGAAGSLNPKLEPGQIIVGKSIIEHDFDIKKLAANEHKNVEEWYPDPNLFQIALSASQRVAGGNRVYAGRILTGDQVIVDAEKREKLRKMFDGDCAEMEAVAVAKVCTHNQIPFIVVRILSDFADHNADIHFDAMLDAVGVSANQILHEILKHDL